MDGDFGKINMCGIFDSAIERPNIKKSQLRELHEFEIEFFEFHNGTSFINGKSFTPQPKTLILAKPHDKRMSIFGFRCYFIHLELPNTSKYYQKLMYCPSYYFVINAEKYKEIFESLSYYCNVKNYNTNEDIVKAKLMELFYFLVDNKKYNNEKISKNQQHIGEIVRFININFAEKLDLETLSEKIGYSKNHFQTLFKTIIGISPQEYVEKVRLKHAKELLNDSSFSITDICYMCGFSSQSYFNYVFKKQTNQTPLSYRRKLLSKYPIE